MFSYSSNLVSGKMREKSSSLVKRSVIIFSKHAFDLKLITLKKGEILVKRCLGNFQHFSCHGSDLALNLVLGLIVCRRTLGWRPLFLSQSPK